MRGKSSKAEKARIISEVLKKSDDLTAMDLLTVARSLHARLDDLRDHTGTSRSWVHTCFFTLLQQPDPTKKNLLESINIIHSEIEKLEGNQPTTTSATTESSGSVPTGNSVSESRPTKKGKGFCFAVSGG